MKTCLVPHRTHVVLARKKAKKKATNNCPTAQCEQLLKNYRVSKSGNRHRSRTNSELCVYECIVISYGMMNFVCFLLVTLSHLSRFSTVYTACALRLLYTGALQLLKKIQSLSLIPLVLCTMLMHPECIFKFKPKLHSLPLLLSQMLNTLGL